MSREEKRLKMAASDASKWYSDGVNFACTGCGKCCSGSPGYVWVGEQEIEELAALLKISVEEFVREHTRLIGNRLSLKERRQSHDVYDCIFLKGKQCQVYEARPKQCRTYPWWPLNMESAETWKNAARECEGINPQAPLVPAQEIDDQLTKHTSNNIL